MRLLFASFYYENAQDIILARVSHHLRSECVRVWIWGCVGVGERAARVGAHVGRGVERPIRLLEDQ